MAIYTIVIAAVWQTSGFVMAMFLAGLRGIDNEILKAAQIDGASNWSLYRRIVIPQLRPAFMSAFVMLAHMAIKSYDLVIALTGGGPGTATELPATFMYSYTFTRNQMGIGAALGGDHADDDRRDHRALPLVRAEGEASDGDLPRRRSLGRRDPPAQGAAGLGRLAQVIRTGRGARFLIYCALVIFCLFYLLPLYVMVVNSLKPLAEIQAGGMMALPRDWTLAPWASAWSTAQIGVAATGLRPYFLNSILMVVPAVAISTVLGALNGYVLTKWRFRGDTWVFGLMLFGCFIPFQIVLIPMARDAGPAGARGLACRG